jgi:hypothetical protein
MRIIIALAAALLSGPALADSVRHLSVPERLWGPWAPSAELCRDDKAVVVVSAKGYVSSRGSCAVQWVTETAGGRGPIYSAHMRCSSPAPAEETTEENLVIVPKDDGQLSVGPNFQDLKSYQQCPPK